MSISTNDLPPGLPPDVYKAAESLKRPDETFYENEEELALVSLLCARGDMDGLEADLEDCSGGSIVRGDDVNDEPPVLFTDLQWLKQLGNRAFQAEDWMGALEQYARILKYNQMLQRESYQPNALPEVEELVVSVRANTAQVLLNLARNEEAFRQCEEALKMSILYDKPALHKKVLHRLELSRQPPSMKARLAAAEVKLQGLHLPPTVTITEGTEISLFRIEESEREAVECAFKMAGGDLVLSSTLLSICSSRSGRPDVDSALKSAREFFLEGGIARPLEREEVLHLMELQGLGERIAERKKEQSQARKAGEAMLDKIVQSCQENLWSECLREDASQTAQLLTQPREWLSSRDRRRAIPYFLFNADRIAKIPLDENKVAKNSKDYQANKPNAIQNLRATVEVAWLQYVGASQQLDLAEYGRAEGESYKPKWKDVEFERMAHKMRLARGMEEPAHSSDIPSKPSNDVGSGDSQAVSTSPDSTRQKSHVPSLQDLLGHKIQQEAQIAAVQRGLKILREAEQEASSDEYQSFDLRAFVADGALKKQVASMKKEYNGGSPPIVDNLWHLCFQEKQGVPTMMLEHLSMEDLKDSRPACVFVANKKIACPPPETREMRFLRPREVQMLPKSTIAVQCLSTDERGGSMRDDIKRALLKAVKARGGIPKKIAVGPVGTIKLFMEYLDLQGGGPPTEELDLSDLSEGDKHYYERSEIEAFIEDTLEVKEQWIEGIFGELPSYRALEERPQKKTPAQHRAQMLKKDKERNAS